MDMLHDYRSSFQAPHLIAVLAAISFVAIAGAWVFEYAGYKPCHLCLMQRYAYYFAVPASLAAWFFVYNQQVRVAQLVLIACAIGYILNAALGGYHAGVEYEWWKGPSDCTGGDTVDSLISMDASKFFDTLKETTVVPCDRPAWTLLGISLAGFNFFISFGLATLALVATRNLSQE